MALWEGSERRRAWVAAAMWEEAEKGGGQDKKTEKEQTTKNPPSLCPHNRLTRHCSVKFSQRKASVDFRITAITFFFFFFFLPLFFFLLFVVFTLSEKFEVLGIHRNSDLYVACFPPLSV